MITGRYGLRDRNIQCVSHKDFFGSILALKILDEINMSMQKEQATEPMQI